MLTHNPTHKTEDEPALNAIDLASGITALKEYFTAGAKTCGNSRIGFELEQIIVDVDNRTVPFTGSKGITGILERLSPLYAKEIRADKTNPSSPLLGLVRKDATITLEPGSQFEFSSMPFWKLQDLSDAWKQYQDELLTVTQQMGYRPLTIGYQPHTMVSDITLLPKERYNMMDQHFKGTGKHGINMMRGTASTQVTIDYNNEADAIIKMRVAAALTPLFSLLTDNSPTFEGAPVRDYLKRTAIWNDVDPARSMIPPGLFRTGYDFAAYAQTALTAPIILFDKDGKVSYAGQKGAADCYDMNHLAYSDIEHILSMLFFDVRLRNYVEIRCADSIPFPYALAYVALIKGLFYDERNLTELNERFVHFNEESVPTIKCALIRDGYEASVGDYYEGSVQLALQDLLYRARRGLQRLSPEEEAYLDVFEPLIAAKTTLAKGSS
ncbi:MAG: glutamate-cysteine ligase family protein [Coriobacteriia bacterium]|nr:glutamate-cysteine ligase family protein [Coriobacteriia bacterium]MCL2870301.1 glutamate-cysteine ligase family protein [Coriobacteriia bacterium]